MSDIGQFKSKYNQYKDTFKSTSYDSENEFYLCTDESQDVINFDMIIENNYPDSNRRPKSFDAIYIRENIVYCIEFKNQKPSKIKNSEIQEKLEHGKDELITLLQKENIDTSDLTFIYAVVYRECKSNRDKFKCGVVQSQIEFGLQKYKDSGFVKDVFTSDVAFFTRAFKLKEKKELAC